MTVLGVLTGLLTSGLGFGVRVWEHERTELDDWSDLQTVQGIIRRVLSQAWPLNVPGPNGTQTGGFIGHRHGHSFSRAVAGAEPAGRHLQIQSDQPHRSRRPAPGPHLAAAGARSQAATIAAAAARHRPRRKARRRRKSCWPSTLLPPSSATSAPPKTAPNRAGRTNGTTPTKLPQLVRVHLTYPPGDRRRWPDLVVAFAVNGTPGEGGG